MSDVGSAGPHQGIRLAELRRAARLSQERLAELTGLSIRSIRGIERGAVRRPHLNSLRQIAEALRLSAPERAGLESSFGYAAPPTPRTFQDPINPAELPRDLADFVGRDEELAAVVACCEVDSERRTTSPVVTVSGLGGSGKTSLAVHAAHRLRDSFPDGQLCVSLAGPNNVGATPEDVLVDLLTSIGLDTRQLPHTHESRVRVYRSVTSDKRYLLLVDNAADARGLSDLLPAGPGNATIITSRPELPELAPDLRVRLDVYSTRDAVALLRSSAGVRAPERASADRDEWEELARLCALLPLALRVAGARLAARPDWGPGDLLERMSSSDDRLAELRHGSLSVADAIRTSFEALPATVTARRIDPGTALLRLGLLPTSDFTTNLAAEVLGCDRGEADEVIGVLMANQLLGSRQDGRHRFHDLVRDFAHSRNRRSAARVDPAETFDALGRYLRRNLERAGDVGLVRPVTVVSVARPFVQDERAHATYQRWLTSEFPSMRDYIVGASVTPGTDLDLVVEVAMSLLDMCTMRDDWVTARLVARTVADAAWQAERWWPYAWAQGHVVFQASMLGEGAVGELLAAAERVADPALAVEPSDRDRILLQLSLTRGATDGFGGRLHESEAAFRRGLRLVEAPGRPIRALLLQNLAESVIRLGRPREALRYLTRDPDLVAAAGVQLRLRGAAKVARCLNLMHAHRNALDLATLTMDEAERVQLPAVCVAAAVEIALAHRSLGRQKQAVDWAREAETRASRLHRPDLLEQAGPDFAALLGPPTQERARDDEGGIHAGPPATTRIPPSHLCPEGSPPVSTQLSSMMVRTFPDANSRMSAAPVTPQVEPLQPVATRQSDRQFPPVNRATNGLLS